MGTISLQLPLTGQPNATEDAKIASDFTALQNLLNGGLDTNNLSASAGITLGQLAAGAGFLAVRALSVDGTAASGQLIIATNVITITLPAPAANSLVGVVVSQSGTSGVTINAAGGSIISSGGTSATLPLQYNGAAVVLMADGTNWFVISGQRDTGWVGLTLGTNWNAIGGGYYAPKARLIGDRVWLRGALVNNTGSPSNAPGSVPGSMVPVGNVAPAFGGSVSLAGFLQIVSGSGVMTLFPSANNGNSVFLDGVSYSLT